MQQIKKASFRQRVFQLPDGSVQLVFGEDQIPADGVILADHDVVETQSVTQHVVPPPPSEPGPA